MQEVCQGEWEWREWEEKGKEGREMGRGGGGEEKDKEQQYGDVVYVYIGVCMIYPSPIFTVKYTPHKALHQHHITTPLSCIPYMYIPRNPCYIHVSSPV